LKIPKEERMTNGAPETAAPDGPGRILDRLDSDRRQFLKKILLSAYVAPFVASFAMKGLGLGEAAAQSNLCFTSNVTVPNTSADLLITASGMPSVVTGGSDITYTLRVENCGPAVATNVSVSDPMPGGTTFVSASQTSGPTFALNPPPVGSGGTFTATISSMNVGDVATFQLTVHVTP
jgi:uncharacterized repeat protein (TIGR01451 family)